MRTEEFVKEVNTLRLSNKGQWYTWQGIVNGKEVAIKGYNTWLQIFRINGLSCWSPMEQSIRDFKELLTNAIDKDNS